ncbi:MAG: 30S ribosomal protein S8 [candidate division WOR-3 bacterium]
MLTDPIADMITRIRNAVRARHEKTTIAVISKLKLAILDILKREGFIKDYRVVSTEKGGLIEVTLNYLTGGRPAINDLQRVSKPGRRIYIGKDEIPWIKNGMGIAIISTSQGVMTDREARKRKIGGEYLLYVW